MGKLDGWRPVPEQSVMILPGVSVESDIPCYFL